CSVVFLTYFVDFSGFFFLFAHLPSISTLFPYTTLFRSSNRKRKPLCPILWKLPICPPRNWTFMPALPKPSCATGWNRRRGCLLPDRKSTRLNSSHVSISYAVFCLQNKTRLPTYSSYKLM